MASAPHDGDVVGVWREGSYAYGRVRKRTGDGLCEIEFEGLRIEKVRLRADGANDGASAEDGARWIAVPRGAPSEKPRVGSRVKMWWEGDGCFYLGQVVEASSVEALRARGVAAAASDKLPSASSDPRSAMLRVRYQDDFEEWIHEDAHGLKVIPPDTAAAADGVVSRDGARLVGRRFEVLGAPDIPPHTPLQVLAYNHSDGSFDCIPAHARAGAGSTRSTALSLPLASHLVRWLDLPPEMSASGAPVATFPGHALPHPAPPPQPQAEREGGREGGREEGKEGGAHTRA